MSSQIYWNEGDTVHLCDSGQATPNDLLVWTLCEKDVPANQGYRTENGKPNVNCQACLQKEPLLEVAKALAAERIAGDENREHPCRLTWVNFDKARKHTDTTLAKLEALGEKDGK